LNSRERGGNLCGVTADVLYLDDAELAGLDAFLVKAGFEGGLTTCDGIFAAIATSPAQLPPEKWLGLVVNHIEISNRDEARWLVGQMLSRFTQVVDSLGVGNVGAFLPPAEDAKSTAEFCAGYIAASKLDAQWKDDDFGVLHLLPMAVLCGDFPLEEVEGVDGRPLPNPEQWCQDRRNHLPANLMTLYAHFAEARRLGAQKSIQLEMRGWTNDAEGAEKANRGTKPERGQPCPCGSGRNYERCCLS
jgi:hypothetical protein